MAAEVNEYFKDKYEDSQKEFKDKLRRHRMTLIYRVAIAAAVVIAFVVFAYVSYQKKVYTDYDVTKYVNYSEASNANYLEFNGNVLRYSQDGASAFSADNDMIWNVTYEMQNPLADTCGEYAAIGDYMGTTIYVFDGEGIKGTIDTSTPLRSFCVSGTGSVAVVLEDDDVTWVKLFDYNGVNIASDKSTMAKSGYPVRVDISLDGILLAVSYLYVDSGVLSSSVAFYNFGAVGQNEIDNLVSGYSFQDTVMSYVKFINSDTAIAIGDDKIAVFKGSEKPEKLAEKPIDDKILSVFDSNDYFGLVFDDDDSENTYKIQVFNDEGEEVCTQGFDIDYSNVTFYKDLIVIYNSDQCDIYNTAGLKKFSGTFDKSAILLIPKSKARYLLVSGECTEEIKLK